MTKKEDSTLSFEHRYKFVIMDDKTQVQLAVATDDLDKFTKTDLMKVVQAFKDGVKKEEEFTFSKAIKKEAKKRNESN